MHFNRMKTLDFILVYFFISSISSAYTITPSQSIKDGQNLTSQSETFELGFFSPSSNSKNRYLGMWYKKIPGQTVVWVANRDSPLNDSSGVLMLSEEGNLVILNRTNHIIWSTNTSKAAKNPIVEFLESGNLVLRDGKADEYLWQSFDHPSDTLLPGMKFGWDLRIGLNRYLRSWKSFDDPSLGDFTDAFELTGNPEIFIRKVSKKYFRYGPFNGIRNSGSPDLKNNSLFVFNFVVNEEEVYYTFRLVNQSIPLRYKLQQNGNKGYVELITWIDRTQSWVSRASRPTDPCDTYGLCGTGSICDVNDINDINDIPYCRCLKGFKPRSPLDYNELDWSMGCEREMPLDCEEGNSFMKLSEVKVPDTMRTFMNTSTSISLEECRIKCLKNCSCVAHANADIRGNGSGCVMWFGDLMDIKKVPGAGQDLYIRSSGLEAGLPKETRSGPERKKADERVIIIIPVIFSVSLLGAVIYFIRRKQIMQILQKVISNKRRAHDIFYRPGEKNDDLELNFFDMDTIVRATHNFSHMSMLGKGGFGCVYKGMLEDGQEIAVKRLSKNSGQGTEEFKNEVMIIARLQHRNLVRLLGLCMEGEEKILVYEYMENKSLDAILFDKANNFKLDWPKRFSIISGISRGLLYLHQDSRFRIIHRDLKASNVLLDGLLNPKISDFGMARIFGGDDTQGETKRVVGTYFGVLVLEIISGKKNKGFFSLDNQLNLVGYAWSLWKEGHPLELIDETVKDSCPSNEALRCIHVGLLCVQEHAKDRPTMSSVVLMLSTDASKVQQPRQPGFCFDISPIEADSTSANQEPCSENDVTVTILEASILLKEGYKLNVMSEKEDISSLMRWKMFLK